MKYSMLIKDCFSFIPHAWKLTRFHLTLDLLLAFSEPRHIVLPPELLCIHRVHCGVLHVTAKNVCRDKCMSIDAEWYLFFIILNWFNFLNNKKAYLLLLFDKIFRLGVCITNVFWWRTPSSIKQTNQNIKQPLTDN